MRLKQLRFSKFHQVMTIALGDKMGLELFIFAVFNADTGKIFSPELLV